LDSSGELLFREIEGRETEKRGTPVKNGGNGREGVKKIRWDKGGQK